MGCRWRSALPLSSVGCRGTACLTMVCSRGCRGISVPVPEYLLPLLPHQPWCLQSCLSHIFLAVSLTAAAQCFLPFLKYLTTVAPPASLTGLPLGSNGSILEPAGTGSVGGRGSLWCLLTKSTPEAPLPPKHCQVNPTDRDMLMKARIVIESSKI